MCQDGDVAMIQAESSLSRCLNFGVWSKDGWERERHNKDQ